MIPRAHITAWRAVAPWPSDAQIEQDLILSRALIDMFRQPAVAEALAFRGGSALHKLFLTRAGRYSEDIDLVQVGQGPIGPALDSIRGALDPWLGAPRRNQGRGGLPCSIVLKPHPSRFRECGSRSIFNTREHFAVFGFHRQSLVVENPWFSGIAQIRTYQIEELLGTKLRALY